MGIKLGIDTNKAFLIIVLGVVALAVITNVINLNAFTSEEEVPILREDIGTNLVPTTYSWLIGAMALILAWRIAMGEGRLDRTKLVSMVVIGVVLYMIYTFIAPTIGLTPINEAALRLQSISPPAIQAILG